MDHFPKLKAHDKPEIVDRVFQMKVKKMVKFLKERKPLGDIVASMSYFLIDKQIPN